MAIQDILPIASISLIVIGFIIILTGFIWMANTMSNQEENTSFSNTTDIIGEMNEMFTYFTDQIENKYITAHEEDFQSETYKEVIKLKNQGKTSEQIAKKLNMGRGEVNLILGIDQMR